MNSEITKYANTRVFILLALMTKYDKVSGVEFEKHVDDDLLDLIQWLEIEESIKEPRSIKLPTLAHYFYPVNHLSFLIGCTVRYMQLQYILYQATFMKIEIED
jgi:hypothetical protein